MEMAGKCKKFIALSLIWGIYVVVGSFIFLAVEGNVHYRRYDKHQWNFSDAFFFVFQVLTTIGYGNLVLVTSLGRALVVLYAFFGIPLTLLLLKVIGEQVLHAQRYVITAVESRCPSDVTPPKWLNAKCFVLGVICFLALILFGGFVHTLSEGWSFEHGAYFSFISYATIGFGDLYPEKNPWASLVIVFLGMSMASNLIQVAVRFPFVAVFFVGSSADSVEKEPTEV